MVLLHIENHDVPWLLTCILMRRQRFHDATDSGELTSTSGLLLVKIVECARRHHCFSEIKGICWFKIYISEVRKLSVMVIFNYVKSSLVLLCSQGMCHGGLAVAM